MKIIKSEKQLSTGSTATSADAEFPVTNLFDNHPRNVWKADATNEATLRIKIDLDSNAIALFATNADDVICTITADADEQDLDNAAAVNVGGGIVGIPCTGHGYSEDDVVLLNGTTNYDGVYTVLADGGDDQINITATYAAETFDGDETVAEVVDTETFDLQVIDDYVHFFNDDPVIYRNFWMDYTYQMYACTATIELTAPTDETIKAGVVKAGPAVVFSNPKYGIQEGRKDYSIKKQLRNGAWYTSKKEIVRTFSGQLMIAREDAYYAFCEVYDLKGPEPFAALIAEEADSTRDKRWVAYVMFDGEFSSQHSTPEYTLVNWSWLEVV